MEWSSLQPSRRNGDSSGVHDVCLSRPFGSDARTKIGFVFMYTGWRKKRGHHLVVNILKFHDRIAWKLVDFAILYAEHSH